VACELATLPYISLDQPLQSECSSTSMHEDQGSVAS